MRSVPAQARKSPVGLPSVPLASPAAVVDVLSAPLDTQSKAAILSGLQQASGNGIVQRLVAQASGAVTPGVTLDPDAQAEKLYNLYLSGFAGVSESDKVELAEQILRTMPRVGRGPQVMYGLWESMGERVVDVAAAHADLWKRCAAYVPRPRELHNLPPIQKVVKAFRRDTERIADGYLSHNYGIVEAEKERVFGETASNRPHKRIANEDAVDRIRHGADLVLRLHKRRRALQQTEVGTISFPGGAAPLRFNPAVKPTQESGGQYASISFKGAKRSWDDVKAEDDKLKGDVAAIVKEQPALFALLRDGKLEGFQLAASMPGVSGRGAAELALSSGLDTLEADIVEAQQALGFGKLEPLDFLPIHDRLLNGDATGSEPWKHPFYRWVAEDAKSRHVRTEFWKSIGLASLGAAAFLLSEFATGGFATVVFAGLGTGISGMQVADAYEQWADLDLAQKASAEAGPGLVYKEQVDAAKAAFYLEAAFGLFDVATAPAALAKLTKGWKAGELGAEGLARGEDAVSGLRDQLVTLTKTTPGAAQTLERAIDTLGKDAVRDASPLGLGELLRIAEGHPSLTKKLISGFDIPPADARAMFERATDQLTGRAAGQLTKAELDDILSRAVTSLGSTAVLREVGGWDKLVGAVGESSATARQILEVRDVTFGTALDQYARGNLPKPPNQETLFERTGTKGSALNDFDASALGPYSAENRAKMRAFAARFFGVAEEELKPLFKIQFFGDPTRLHLVDYYLTPEMRARVSGKLLQFERELALNRMLFDAIRDEDVLGEQMARSLMVAANILPVYRPPAGMIQDLSKRLDDWQQALVDPKVPVAQHEKLVEQIHMVNSQINAIEEGGYLTAGGAKNIVTDKENLAGPLNLPHVAMSPAHDFGLALDQVLKASHEMQRVRKSLDDGDLLVAVKEMSKIFDRFATVAERAASTPRSTFRPGTDAFARHESLVLDLLPFARESRELLAEARGKAAVTLADRIATDRVAVEAAARSAADQFSVLVSPVLDMMRKRAGIEARLGDASLLAKGQDLVEAEMRVIWAKNGVHRILEHLDSVNRSVVGMTYVAQVLCGLRKAQPGHGTPEDKPLPP